MSQLPKKPWFQRELERITGERWRLAMLPHSATMECGHGMLIRVSYPPGAHCPFMTAEQERAFVRKVLPRHASDYRLREGSRETLEVSHA